MLQEEEKAGCSLCPRECKADRVAGKKGYCGESAVVRVARAALHFWEEPCISGKEGSGAIFFCGCPLHCIFCQNYLISQGEKKRKNKGDKAKEEDGFEKKPGKEISVEKLKDIFLNLQHQGANNLNLVTGTHYIPQIRKALIGAKQEGLQIPVVYNTGGYEKAESLKLLEGLVDIYLPDCKYYSSRLSKEYSHAEDYFSVTTKAIEEMVHQVGEPVMDEKGILQRGVMVRHMILPGSTADSKKILEYLLKTYGNKIFISLMNQYTPMEEMKDHPLLKRRVTKREYEKVIAYGFSLGWEKGYIQEKDTAQESFVPLWNEEGLA